MDDLVLGAEAGTCFLAKFVPFSEMMVWESPK